jgi:hypothetical protein
VLSEKVEAKSKIRSSSHLGVGTDSHYIFEKRAMIHKKAGKTCY